MPAFEDVYQAIQTACPRCDHEFEVDADTSVDFEIFCAECGAGICDHGETAKTHHRKMPYISVRPCDRCTKKLLNEIEELKAEIIELKDRMQ